MQLVRSERAVAIVSSAALLVAALIGPINSAAQGAEVSSPVCLGSNLVAALASNQVSTGHVVTIIAITNIGSGKCTLRGYPGLIGLRGNQETKLHVTRHGTYGGNLEPAVLAPRMSGALIIGTGDLCAPFYGVPPATKIFSGLTLVLPGNKGDLSVLGVSVDTSCYLDESQVGWRRHFSIKRV